MQARPREPSRPGGRARLARAQLEATSSRSLLANMQGVAGAIYKLHRPAAADGIHGSSPLYKSLLPSAHFFRCFALRSSRPSGLPYCTRSPILPGMRPHSVSGSPLGSAASRVRVSAVSTRLEFCAPGTQVKKRLEQ